MTDAQKHLRNQLLTKIHTQSEYKNIVKFGGKEAWSEWVYVRFGAWSCKRLSIDELKQVLRFLQDKEQWSGEMIKPDLYGRYVINTENISPKQNTQILSYKKSLGWSKSRFYEFVAHQTGVKIARNDFLALLDKKQATKLITGLKKIITKKD